jgi:hypothetical protein
LQMHVADAGAGRRGVGRERGGAGSRVHMSRNVKAKIMYLH